jgi:hypothetical protein
VDLIGAVHVGDVDYYQTLNRHFEQYDALLYELVAPEGTAVPAKGEAASSRHPVGALQNLIKDVLELEHQLVHIDYRKKNFVHADMSPAELAKAMSDRGESFSQMLFRMIGQSMAQQSKLQAQGDTTDLDLLAALFARDRPLRLKRIMADQFEEMESLLAGVGGPDGSTLIEGRNEVALRVLRAQIAEGKKKLAVFYGAGHLADMDRRLREDFELQPVRVRWLTAWDLHTK